MSAYAYRELPFIHWRFNQTVPTGVRLLTPLIFFLLMQKDLVGVAFLILNLQVGFSFLRLVLKDCAYFHVFLCAAAQNVMEPTGEDGVQLSPPLAAGLDGVVFFGA